jgi:hypothetical protein
MVPDRKPSIAPLKVLAAGMLLSLTCVTAAWAGGGGVGAPAAPQPADVTCIKKCLDVRTVAVGGKVQITGTGLQTAQVVSFPADGGKYVDAKARRASATSLKAKVPSGAGTGRPVVADAYGQSATVPSKLKVTAAETLARTGKFKVTSAHVSPRKSYIGGRKPTAT